MWFYSLWNKLPLSLNESYKEILYIIIIIFNLFPQLWEPGRTWVWVIAIKSFSSEVILATLWSAFSHYRCFGFWHPKSNTCCHWLRWHVASAQTEQHSSTFIYYRDSVGYRQTTTFLITSLITGTNHVLSKKIFKND